MSAPLMRRVAEAVDGDQSGRTKVWVVARTDSPHTVAGVLGTQDSATALAKRSGQTYAALGPFDASTAMQRFSGSIAELICEHVGVSNTYPATGGHWLTGGTVGFTAKAPRICVDTIRPPGNIIGISMMYEYSDGKKWVVPLRPGADAVFLSVSALDKFVFPYYAKVLSIDGAAAMRREMLGIK